MTPHKQLLLHDPDNGVYGDCYRTALGCLLDMPPEQVPHFLENLGADSTGTEWQAARDLWLAEQGYRRLRIGFQPATEAAVEIIREMVTEDGGDPDTDVYPAGLPGLLQMMGHVNPGIYYLLVGMSSSGVNHVVIGCGDEIVHDPHPSNVGVVAPIEEFGMYEFEFLIPLGLTRR